MMITVAICTWNRAALLRRTLEEMTRLQIPPTVEWEFLVVNNNCSDATDVIIAEFRDRLPLRRLFEPRPGLSHARNAAVAAARGEYILWTDDDVLVDPEWMCAYAEAFTAHPDAAMFGGPIAPWFEAQPPHWMEDAFAFVGGAFALRSFDASPQRLSRERLPFGANMAFRLTCLRQFLFSPDLGRVGAQMVSGEEEAVMGAMLDAGMTGWSVPDARVRHYIPRERQTTAYLRSYFFGAGATSVRMTPPQAGPRIAGRPRWMWRQAVEAEARYLIARAFCRPATWVRYLNRAAFARGQLAAAREPQGMSPTSAS